MFPVRAAHRANSGFVKEDVSFLINFTQAGDLNRPLSNYYTTSVLHMKD